MAYKTAEIEKQSVETIEKYKLIKINEIFAFVTFAQSTFYLHKLEESELIKNAINKNRLALKAGLRKKWYESDNPTVQIALYRLMADEDELARLNTQKIEHAGGIKSDKTINVEIVGGSVKFPSSESEVDAE